jgi:CRP/FNR family transcriptional regulator
MGGHVLGLDLPSLARKVLGRRFQFTKFPAGSRIFVQGTPPVAYYLVKDGEVKITRITPNGNETILCLPTAGETFCPVPLMDHGLHLGTATAITGVSILVIPQADFTRLCADNHDLSAAVQGACLNSVRRLLRRMEMNSFRSARSRVAFILLGAQLPHVTNSQGQEEVTVTHQTLAELVGISRETVSRILARWAREGTVAGSRGRLTILNVERLRRTVLGK